MISVRTVGRVTTWCVIVGVVSALSESNFQSPCRVRRRDASGSQLLALVPDSQFELPALKAHQHTAKLVPADFSPIDNEKWHAAIAGIVPLNPSTHYSLVRDLQSVLTLREMFGGKGTPHFFDQSTEQNQQVFLRISDDLEVVPSGVSVAKLEGVERHSGAEQMGSKVKLVDFSS